VRFLRVPTGGPDGNERLTATIGLLLVGLLVVEAATTLSLHDFLAVHLFLGLALLPVISAKLASTGWRFVRYYAHDAAYRLRGPPQLFLRALAPLLVTSTVVLFGTGVAFLVVGGRGGLLLTAHAASFIVWGVLVSLHTLAYLRRVFRDGLIDWRPGTRRLAGAALRRSVVLAVLAAGVVVGLATYSVQSGWLAHRHHHRFELRASVRR
jgi:hypothetical protein